MSPPAVRAIGDACSHHRQEWGAGMLPCATPGCRDGHKGDRLVVIGPERPPALGFSVLEPDLEDATPEEIVMRRTQPAELRGAWAWRVKG